MDQGTKVDFNKYSGSSHSVEQFRNDAEQELGTTGHDKADWMWGLAWKHGHEGGFEEVFSQLVDLKAMLIGDKNESDRSLN
jgi:hypothetical protein